jgi:hypothetical protein
VQIYRLVDDCGNPVSFERGSEDEPSELEICDKCGDGVCPDCVDWGATGDNETVCLNCSGASRDNEDTMKK